MTRSDWKLVAILISVSLLLLGIRLIPVAGGQIRAQVELEGKIVRTINLQDVEAGVVTIPLKQGEAHIEVKPGGVRLLPMPKDICPRKICSHTGWIVKPGETIICVPNRLVIRLTGESGEVLDAVTR